MPLCYFKTPALCKNLVENTAKPEGVGAEQPEPGADWVSGSQVIGASYRAGWDLTLLTAACLTQSGPILPLPSLGGAQPSFPPWVA